MATMRFTARIDRPADDVWAAVSVPDAIADWFPGVLSAETEGNVRTVRGGSDGDEDTVEDVIVTNDGDLRRFQYHVSGAEGHLATVDVHEIGERDTLAVYSVEVASDEVAEAWRPYMAAGVEGLKRHLESTAG